MVDAPKTSFIPKQTLGSMPGRVARRKHFNVFRFMGMVVFLCGMILAVGVFLYKDYSQRELVRRQAELKTLKDAFNQGDIAAIRELDRRIKVSKALLDTHLSPSVVFDALELRTQQDARFTNFSYDRRESGSIEVILEGMARRFNTIALQSQQLADAQVLARTIFSGLTVDEDGTVYFTATSEADTSALAFTAPMTAVPAEESATSTAVTTEGSATTTSATPPTALPPAPPATLPGQ